MKLFGNLKFRTQLNISFTIITLFIIITIMLMLHFILRDSYRERESLVLQTYGRQIANNIENRVDYFISYLKLLANDRDLIKSMEDDSYQKVSALLDSITEEFINFNAERISGIKLH